MATSKVYTVKENLHPSHSKNHRLVRAAYRKGLTGIKISWYGAMSRYVNGWILESDQIPQLHLGYQIKEAEERINKISI